MILVTGATGNIGSELVDLLASSGEPVRALVRRPPPVPVDGVEHVTGDLDDPASLAPALDGVQGVFLLPGYRDMPGILAEARRAGVGRVVQLSGASAGSGDMTNAVTRYMIVTERALHDSGLPWTVLRPSAFMSNALRWLPQLNAGDTLRLPFANVRAAAVDPRDIAAVAAKALLDDGHAGQTYYPTGPESLLPAEQVAILGDVLGRDLRFEAQPDDEARAEMTGQMPAEYVDAFFDFYVNGSLDESIVRSTVQDITGTPPRTFRQWAESHTSAFT
ncbi:SDR family oxidoreductase [Actinomadura sp. KC06]|uniref:SDR family oxidoreductase n=1 Tax=Actinomadura sp. KC06 TaxID=2530369 RepID=UPI0010536AB0|nr:SDR family oxidoreductase [Actinomadura sp. KC06]TDD14273.1 SDR family oxidoreductase [Actinomadura sp. KC06]